LETEKNQSSEISSKISDDDKEKIDDVVNEYNENKNNQKKKRHRRTKEQIEADKTKSILNPSVQAETFAKGFTLTATILVRSLVTRMPNGRPLDKDEDEAFSESLKELSIKYYSLVGKYATEFNFLVAVLTIFISRLDFKKMLNGKQDNNNIGENGTGEIDTN